MKKLIASTSALMMVFGTVLPAYAADSATNTRTGAQSVNLVNTTRLSRVNTLNANVGGVLNLVGSDSSTGGASADKNTGGKNTVLTGNSKTTTTVATALNQENITKVNANCGCDGGNVASNNKTGYKSLNMANVTTSSNVNTLNLNGALVVNAIHSSSSTGGASADMNTGGGNVVMTGNATTTTTVSNTLNQGSTTIVNP